MSVGEGFAVWLSLECRASPQLFVAFSLTTGVHTHYRAVRAQVLHSTVLDIVQVSTATHLRWCQQYLGFCHMCTFSGQLSHRGLYLRKRLQNNMILKFHSILTLVFTIIAEHVRKPSVNRPCDRPTVPIANGVFSNFREILNFLKLPFYTAPWVTHMLALVSVS